MGNPPTEAPDLSGSCPLRIESVEERHGNLPTSSLQDSLVDLMERRPSSENGPPLASHRSPCIERGKPIGRPFKDEEPHFQPVCDVSGPEKQRSGSGSGRICFGCCSDCFRFYGRTQETGQYHQQCV